MNVTVIRQRIKVGATFEGENIIPKWFKWADKKFEIKKVNLKWKSTIGGATLYHFSLDDGKNIYEISFNQKSLEWMLEKVGVE
jgi:hypothetical protein